MGHGKYNVETGWAGKIVMEYWLFREFNLFKVQIEPMSIFLSSVQIEAVSIFLSFVQIEQMCMFFNLV